jgi:hypothetical protein
MKVLAVDRLREVKVVNPVFIDVLLIFGFVVVVLRYQTNVGRRKMIKYRSQKSSLSRAASAGYAY